MRRRSLDDDALVGNPGLGKAPSQACGHHGIVELFVSEDQPRIGDPVQHARPGGDREGAGLTDVVETAESGVAVALGRERPHHW